MKLPQTLPRWVILFWGDGTSGKYENVQHDFCDWIEPIYRQRIYGIMLAWIAHFYAYLTSRRPSKEFNTEEEPGRVLSFLHVNIVR